MITDAGQLYYYFFHCRQQVVVTEEDRQRLQQSLKELLQSICDSAHEQCGRLLSSRTKDGALLERVTSQEFVALAQMIDRFIDDCQEISGHRALGLRLAFQVKSRSKCAKLKRHNSSFGILFI